MDEKNLLEVKDLKVRFSVKKGLIKAVDGTSFNLEKGKTLGIIGESGCGKSVTARAILNMVPRPGIIAGGSIDFRSRKQDGRVIRLNELDPGGDEIRRVRGGEIAMIFQEPMSSLTPVYTAGNHIKEALDLHYHRRTIGESVARARRLDPAEAEEIAADMLDKVGIPRAKDRVRSYPHELSGGQRQRVMIAISLSCDPSILIADEPTTALDVSIEAQILKLMKSVQESRDTSIIFITHNLGVVVEMADKIAVMYLGKMVEYGDMREIFKAPRHPYTRALMESVPRIGRKSRRLNSIKGMVPDPFELPRGCLFGNRCERFKKGVCDQGEPPVLDPEDHMVRCHFPDS